MVRASLRFLQDCGIAGIEAWLVAQLGERIGRRFGTYMISGTGNAQPEGLAVSTTLGRTAAAAAAISYVDLVELEHSVNIVYRQNAEFLLSDGALKVIKQLTDGNDRPLWLPGLATKEPDSILGYKYQVDPNMPTPASAAKSVYFGDFSKFLIRDVTQVQMLRLTERYAEYLQVAFLLFSMHDSCLLDAGTHPIRHLVHP
jgi:HK97 family phage major capsid protein